MRTHRLARNITMRVKPDGLHVTVPPYSLSSKVMEVVEQYRERLLQDWQRVCKKSIDLDFRIQAPCFRLWLEKGNFTCFSVRNTEEGIKIICPRDVDFTKEEVQRLVRNAIIRAMKKVAGEYLPPLLDALAEHYGLSYKTSEDNRKQKDVGAVARRPEYKPFLLFDAVASAPDGLCAVARAVAYKRNESRSSFLGTAGQHDGGKGTSAAGGVTTIQY